VAPHSPAFCFVFSFTRWLVRLFLYKRKLAVVTAKAMGLLARSTICASVVSPWWTYKRKVSNSVASINSGRSFIIWPTSSSWSLFPCLVFVPPNDSLRYFMARIRFRPLKPSTTMTTTRVLPRRCVAPIPRRLSVDPHQFVDGADSPRCCQPWNIAADGLYLGNCSS